MNKKTNIFSDKLKRKLTKTLHQPTAYIVDRMSFGERNGGI